MSVRSLEDVLQEAGNPVKLLRNSQTGPYIYPVVPAEFSNWRDEQRAWRDTAIFFNQSYHMTDMYMDGPDALKVLTMLGINSFKDFGPNKAKQPIGRFGSFKSARERRRALHIALTASCWPTTL